MKAIGKDGNVKCKTFVSKTLPLYGNTISGSRHKVCEPRQSLTNKIGDIF